MGSTCLGVAMSDKDLPAFPSDYVKHKRMEVGNEVPIVESSSGMTLRDYFAAKSMQGLTANEKGAYDLDYSQRAEWAYKQADAMIEARKA